MLRTKHFKKNLTTKAAKKNCSKIKIFLNFSNFHLYRTNTRLREKKRRFIEIKYVRIAIYNLFLQF